MIKRTLIMAIAIVTLSGIHAQAQKKAIADPKKIAQYITDESILQHLKTLASDEFEGRETATEGQKKAAAYIESQFKSFGLKPGNKGSYQMDYPVYRDSLISSQVKVNEEAFLLNSEFQPFNSFFSNKNGTQYFSEIVFVGYGIEDSSRNDYKNTTVAGKAVMFFDGIPEGYNTSIKGWRSPAGMIGKLLKAAEKGAVAVLIISSDFPKKTQDPLGNMYVNMYSPRQLPQTYTVSTKIAEKIAGKDWASINQKSLAPESKTFEANVMLETNKGTKNLVSSNVLGVLESNESDEWLIVTGHYDHLGKRGNVIYYGADDDGSGTTGVLEIAKAFAKAKEAGKGPKRNILFMTVSGEEKGLWGSEYFSDHPTMPMEKVTADLNIDMIGRVDTERKTADTLNYVYVVGDDKLSTELKPLSEGVNNKYIKMTLDYKFNDPNDKEQIYFRSDHYNFARKGVPVIFY
ncbi:MAG: M28 family peptidase, partial [Chitinophagaceae bacterium]